jgi:hypothetical protein
MAEFAGYVGNQVPPVDWGKIGTDLYDKINKVNDERKAEKEKIDNDYNESFSKIGDYEQTTDQSLNEMIYKGVDEVRSAMKTQYDLLKKGAITMADYKLYKNTAMTDWSTLNKAVKGYGNTIAGVQKIITDGKMSGLGQYNALTYAKLSNLKDAKIMVNPETGRIYRANIDPKTGTIASDSEVSSPSAMLNPGNLVDLKVDINDGVTAFLKRVSDYGFVTDLGGGKIKVSENARNNPSYKKALEAQINSFTVTPRSTTSVLTDYVGDYQFFESDAQKKELIAKGTPEDNLIKVERKNGVYEPVPTEAQENVAKEFVRNQIEVGVGQKESQTEGFSPKAPKEVKVDKVPDAVVKRRDLYAHAVNMSETFRKDPTNAQVLSEIQGLYPTNSVIVEPYRRGDNAIIGFNIFQKDEKGNKMKGSNVGGTYDRIRIDPDGIYQRLTSNNRMGEEYGTSETAKRDWVQSGGDANRTLFNYRANTKKESTPTGNVKIVTLDMVKQKLGKGATQAQINAYAKQLEATGNYKVQTK